jgi:hypothetical protein
LRHHANAKFWACYDALPQELRQTADRNFALLRDDPHHPSLSFKRVNRYWSVRVGLGHRALATRDGDDFIWFWIGEHGEYDRLTR